MNNSMKPTPKSNAKTRSVFLRIIMLAAIFPLISLLPLSLSAASAPSPSPAHLTNQMISLASIPNCPPSISFGEIVNCDLGSVGEVDSYTFSGTAGDRVFVRFSRSSGSFWPYVNIKNPDTTNLCGGVNGLNHSSVGIECTLPSSGIYTIQTSDYNHTGTGDYYIYLQRYNDPGSPIAIAFGQTVQGSLLLPAQTDTYTFTGSPGDKIFLRLVRSPGSFWASLYVYNPDGTGLCGGYGGLEHDRISATCTLPASGTFTVLVGDHDGVGSGDYYLYSQRLNNPPNPLLSIGYGQIKTGTIAFPTQMDTYSFSAAAGDKVVLAIEQVSETYFGPLVMLFGSDGIQLCNTSSHFIDNCSLPAAGTYTILAGENDESDSGGYYLFLQRLNSPVNSIPLAFGQTHSGAISTPTQMDPFSFTATAGDKVFLRMSVATDEFRPEIRLYASDGSLLARDSGGFNAEIAGFTIPSSGEYFILVDDYYGYHLDDYYLFLQRLNNPGNATSISSGQTLSGSILHLGEIDTYTFTAASASNVLLRMARPSYSDTLWPEIALYGPDGSLLCGKYGYNLAEIIACALPSPGIYTILLDDYYHQYSGNYTLYMQTTIAQKSFYLPLIVR